MSHPLAKIVVPTNERSHMNNTLTLIDTENALGGAITAHSPVGRLADVLKNLLGDTGHLVVATSYGPALMHVKAQMGGAARYVYKDGRDGAERAIEKYMNDYFPVGSVARLNIVSGDHYFAELARAHRDAGCLVTVVAPQGTLAHDLYRESSINLVLPQLVVTA